MMTDRELLELAAKAAGITFPKFEQVCGDDAPEYWEGMGFCVKVKWGRSGLGDEPFPEKWWNPLKNDGDALRLAVKLEMDLSLGLNGCVVLPDPNIKLEELSSNDPYAATRRAIVRAAAEIGRTM